MFVFDKATKLEDVGGKAWQLFRMKEKGFPIPDLVSISFNNIKELDDPKNQKAILDICDSLESSFFAIRSSATCEDASLHSFAGMFETKLCITREGVIDAIKGVWNSANSCRVMTYCQTNHIDIQNVKMRIIIQKQLLSRISGVCFTRTTGTETHDKLMIEAIFGMGELLVSGLVTPNNFIIDRETHEEVVYSPGNQKLIIGDPTGRYEEGLLPYRQKTELPFAYRRIRKVSPDELQQIVSIAIQLEETLGFYAADVEWAFEKNKLFITQARSYTGVM